MEKVHIIGGGPVGCCMSLILAQRKIPSVIYEKNHEIKYTQDDNYSLGLTQRGIKALRNANGNNELVRALSADHGYVGAWVIFLHKFQVACQYSGQAINTSRSRLNEVLVEGTYFDYIPVLLLQLSFLLQLMYSCYSSRMASPD